MIRRPTPTALVGFVALGSLLLLLGFTFLIKKALFGPRREINVLYERISGLEVGSPVYVAGVYAGEVVRISYRPQYLGMPVVVTVAIKHKFDIHQDANIQIAQAGLLGDKRIEIDPGTTDAPLVSDGDTITGQPQFDMGRSFKEAQQIVSDLAVSVRSLRDFLTDEANLGALRNSLKALEETLINVNGVVLRVDGLLTQNERDMNELVANLHELSGQALRIAGKAEKLVDTSDREIAALSGNLARSADALVTESRRLAERFERTADESSALVAETRSRLRPTLENVESASASLSEILQGIREGRGTVGQLVNNPSPFMELDRVLRAIRRALVGESGPSAVLVYEGLPLPTPTPSAAIPASPLPSSASAP